MLREREKLFVAGGGVAATLIVLFSVVVIPAASRIRTQARAAAFLEANLAEMRRLRPEAERIDRAIRAKIARIQALANASESTLTRLSAAIQAAGVPQQAVTIAAGGAKDSEFVREEIFDVKVENITFLEAARLADRIENGELALVIRSARLKARYDDARYLDANFRIGFLLPRSR